MYFPLGPAKIVTLAVMQADHACLISCGIKGENAKRQKKYSEYIYSCIICLKICAR